MFTDDEQCGSFPVLCGGAEASRVTHIAISYPETGGNPLKRELFSRLEDWAEVDLFDPYTTHPELERNGYDLYHNAKRRNGALQDQRRAEAAGVRTLNSSEGSYVVLNRRATLEHLQQIDVQTPDWEYGMADTVTAEPPVVAKPPIEIGEDRHDVRFHGTEQYDGFPFTNGSLEFPGVRVVEEYIPGGRHVKAYRIGEETRAVELDDPLQWDGEEIDPDPAMVETVEQIGDHFGLCIFETDLVEQGDDIYVVDVNQTVNGAGVDDFVDVYEDAIREQLQTPPEEASPPT